MLPDQLPASAMKSYQILQPLRSHFRDATCEEVECDANAHGWISVADVSTDLGQGQANYILNKSGRAFTYTQDGTMVRFTFPAGQRCFREHKVKLDRPQIFIERDGNAASNPRGTTPQRHNAETWVDSFAEHQQRLSDRMERG